MPIIQNLSQSKTLYRDYLYTPLPPPPLINVIGNFKKHIAKIRGKFHVYVFSFGEDDYAEEFVDMADKVQIHPIPEEILRTYRQIFQKEA